MILKFYVKYQTLYLLSRDPVVADSSGYLQANFQFTEDWDGTNKTAQFKRTESDLITDGKPLFFNEEIDNNGNCIIPWEVLKGEGTFNVNVFGQKTESDGTTVKTITVNSLDIRVGQSGLTTNEFPQDSTPNQYDNIYEEIQKAGKKTQASQTAAAASQAAAKTSETNASTSATNAANSAISSANSATAAANSATAAATSEINAKASKTAALASQKAASTSETNAKTSETNAASSATAAATSETNAKASKTAASASATNAKTSETNAASSATASASSASAAKTSENNAASSKTAAATSATNAAASAKAAATSADNAAASANAAANSAKAAANSAKEQQADWNVTDSTSKAFIKNKPEVVSYEPGQYKEVLEWKNNCVQSVTEALATDHPNAYNYGVQVTLGRIGYGGNTRIYFPHNGGMYFKNFWNTSNNTGWHTVLDDKNFLYYALAKNGIAAKATADAAGNNIQTTYAKKSDLSSSVSTTSLTVTGTTSVPTANAGNSSKAIANTEFVAKSLASLVNGAPDQLNTLNELAKALGNDANFSATITAELAKKLNSNEAESTYATKTEAGVPYQIKRNTAYKVGDVLTSPSLPPGCVIVVTQAGTTGSAEPDWATIKSNMGGGNS